MIDHSNPHNEHELIPISKMAELHGISRQALILYDKMDLFKPAYKSESGYRYYDANQIPELREICFLRQLGVSLPDIQSYMTMHSPELAYEFLVREEQKIQRQGYEVAGKIFDLCLLDSLYHDENRKEDFCQLIVPVRRRSD